MNRVFVILLLIISFSSCNQNIVFEDMHDIKDALWTYDDVAKFESNIVDTSARYNIYFNVRHTNQYPNMNLWVFIKTYYPSGRVMEDKVEIPLASKEGQWYGSGLSDIISGQVMMQQNAKFPEKGKYKFEIAQYMRHDPIKEIMDIGLTLEKVSD